MPVNAFYWTPTRSKGLSFIRFGKWRCFTSNDVQFQESTFPFQKQSLTPKQDPNIPLLILATPPSRKLLVPLNLPNSTCLPSHLQFLFCELPIPSSASTSILSPGLRLLHALACPTNRYPRQRYHPDLLYHVLVISIILTFLLPRNFFLQHNLLISFLLPLLWP